jgi:PD-(D/E)XK nuclease superfamily
MPPRSGLTNRPRRHSYSSLKRYKECPARYYYSYIMKIPEESSAAMDRGTRLHSLCENYMRAGPDIPVPYDIRKIGIKLYQLRTVKAVPEETWLLDADWNPTEDIERAKLKAIIDVHWRDNDVLRLHDYKSGRPYPDHESQLEFYSAVGLRRFEDARRAESSAIYIDTGFEGSSRSIIREMLPPVIERWQTLMDKLDGDGRFLPSAGGHCKWCPYRSDKGGECEAWRGNE